MGNLHLACLHGKGYCLIHRRFWGVGVDMTLFYHVMHAVFPRSWAAYAVLRGVLLACACRDFPACCLWFCVFLLRNPPVQKKILAVHAFAVFHELTVDA